MKRKFTIVFGVLFAVALVGYTVPIAMASGLAQVAPIDSTIVPELLQVALVMLIAQGLKSLLTALGGKNDDGTPKIDLKGREAAIAYIVVGIIVYSVEKFLVPALDAANAQMLIDFLQVLALLLAGSGLYDTTAFLRSKIMGGAKL